MRSDLGPYVQMRRLAEKMATHFQKDTNLALEPHLAHFMDEVEVNVAADTFDHADFMSSVRTHLENEAIETHSPRRKEFLLAVADALKSRLNKVPS